MGSPWTRDKRRRKIQEAFRWLVSSQWTLPELPILLNRSKLREGGLGCVDVLLTTSMFGTGVDTTQFDVGCRAAENHFTIHPGPTGRVGRNKGALVGVSFRGAPATSRLGCYERFLSYHLQIHRYVEPVTVDPYSMAVLERWRATVSGVVEELEITIQTCGRAMVEQGNMPRPSTAI